MKLPNEFLINMKQLLKDDFDLFLSSYENKPLSSVRANTLKVSAKELSKLLEIEFDKVPWCEDGMYTKESYSKSPYYRAGLFYIQEASAMLPVTVLNPSPGDYVLDVCAAPGGKTTQIASKLQNKGVLIANDISRQRIKALIKNMNLAGVTNSIVTCEEPKNLAKTFNNFFNKILVDAPCSGEGMFRSKPETIKDFCGYSDNPYPKIQLEILTECAKMLAPEGFIAYSTCTFNIYENEKIIQQFLDKCKDFILINIENSEKMSLTHSNLLENDSNLGKCRRIFPQIQKGEGHFVALLQKRGYNSESVNFKNNKLTSFCEPFENFKKDIGLNIKTDELFIHQNSLFQMPKNLPDLSKLRIASSGFYLGDINKSNFVPSMALSMALKRTDVLKSISFNIDDNRLYKYLRGESFDLDLENGWYLVCLSDYPLGFAKVVNNYLKNKIELI